MLIVLTTVLVRSAVVVVRAVVLRIPEVIVAVFVVDTTLTMVVVVETVDFSVDGRTVDVHLSQYPY